MIDRPAAEALKRELRSAAYAHTAHAKSEGCICRKDWPCSDRALLIRAADFIRDALAEVDAYKRAKAENDERFMLERDEARAERDALRAKLDALAVPSEHAGLVEALNIAGAPAEHDEAWNMQQYRELMRKAADALTAQPSEATLDEIERRVRRGIEHTEVHSARECRECGHALALKHVVADLMRSAIASPPSVPTPSEHGLACADCRLPYSDPGWADFVVSDEVWARIAPEPCVLCATCMFRRMHSVGIASAEGAFTSGPCAQDGFRKSSQPSAPVPKERADLAVLLRADARTLREFYESKRMSDIADDLDHAADALASPQAAAKPPMSLAHFRWHGCLTGDCPHKAQTECDAALVADLRAAVAAEPGGQSELAKEGRALLAKATPAPWEAPPADALFSKRIVRGPWEETPDGSQLRAVIVGPGVRRADAVLIPWLRNNADALLRALESSHEGE